MDEWIALSSLAALTSPPEVEEIIRGHQVRMRGEYCPDYTVQELQYRSDPVDIPRLFVLNSDFLCENDRLIAHPDFSVGEKDTNFEMYSFVVVASGDFAKARKSKLAGRRGRRTTHDWDSIFLIALTELEGWTDSQNKFIEHIRNELKLEYPGRPIPDQSTLKKRLAPLFNQWLKSTGA